MELQPFQTQDILVTLYKYLVHLVSTTSKPSKCNGGARLCFTVAQHDQLQCVYVIFFIGWLCWWVCTPGIVSFLYICVQYLCSFAWPMDFCGSWQSSCAMPQWGLVARASPLIFSFTCICGLSLPVVPSPGICSSCHPTVYVSLLGLWVTSQLIYLVFLPVSALTNTRCTYVVFCASCLNSSFSKVIFVIKSMAATVPLTVTSSYQQIYLLLDLVMILPNCFPFMEVILLLLLVCLVACWKILFHASCS